MFALRGCGGAGGTAGETWRLATAHGTARALRRASNVSHCTLHVAPSAARQPCRPPAHAPPSLRQCACCCSSRGAVPCALAAPPAAFRIMVAATETATTTAVPTAANGIAKPSKQKASKNQQRRQKKKLRKQSSRESSVATESGTESESESVGYPCPCRHHGRHLANDVAHRLDR